MSATITKWTPFPRIETSLIEKSGSTENFRFFAILGNLLINFFEFKGSFEVQEIIDDILNEKDKREINMVRTENTKDYRHGTADPI